MLLLLPLLPLLLVLPLLASLARLPMLLLQALSKGTEGQRVPPTIQLSDGLLWRGKARLDKVQDLIQDDLLVVPSLALLRG